jgi:hypothetical protein
MYGSGGGGRAESIDRDVTTLAAAGPIGKGGVGLSETPLRSITALTLAVPSIPGGVLGTGQALAIDVVEPIGAGATTIHINLVGSASDRSVHLGRAGALTTVEDCSLGTLLAEVVDERVAIRADAGGTVPGWVLTAWWGGRLALARGSIMEVSLGAVFIRGAFSTIPAGACRARPASIDGRLVESVIAGTGDTIEEGVLGAVRDNLVNGGTLAILQEEAWVADTLDTIEVGILRAVGDVLAGTSQEDCTLDADTGLEGGVESLVVVAVGCEVGLDALAIDISIVSDQALTDDAVVGLVGSAGLARSQDPEEPFLAVALSVSEVPVLSTVLVVTAHSVNHRKASITDAALGLDIEMTVEGAEIGGDALALVGSGSVLAFTLAVDVGLVGWADGVAEAIGGLEARLAETLIRVAIVVVSGGTVGAYALDADVLRLADALLRGIREVLIHSLAGDTSAGLGELIIGLGGEALGACSLDDVEPRSAVTLATVEVVDLVGSALHPADPLVDIVDLAGGALRAEVVDEEEPRLADTPSGDPILVDIAPGSTDSVAALAWDLVESRNAVTALRPLVVDLGPGVALRADTADQVESRQAAAGADSGVPDLVGLAASPADTVGGIVGLRGRADSAAVSNQVVALPALALAVNPLFVGIAGRDAESETEQVSIVADALLGDGGVSGVEGTGGAGSIGHLVELGQTGATLFGDIVDPSRIAGDPADTQALIVDLVPLALSANSVDGVVSSDAATLPIGKHLIDPTSNHAESTLIPISGGTSTSSRLDIEGGIAGTLGADFIDTEEGCCAVAGLVDVVVDLVGLASDTADLEGHIEEGARGTGLADAADQEESPVADALLVDVELVGSAGTGRDGEGPGGCGGTSGDDAVAIVEGVPLDAVTSPSPGVVDGEGGTASALSVDRVETSATDAGEGIDIQDLV